MITTSLRRSAPKLLAVLILGSLFFYLHLSSKIAHATGTAWHQTYTPYRNLYVSTTGTGGQISDYSSGSDTGTVFDQPESVSGKVGSGALDFNGSSDYVQLSSGVADWGSAYTIESWVKTTSSDNPRSDVVYPILGTGHTTSTGAVGQAFGIEAGKLTFSANEGGYRSGCSSTPLTIQGGNVADGSWHHVAMTMNPNTRYVALYIDGVLSASGTLARIKTDCGIGAMDDIGKIGTLGTNFFFGGAIDELRVYQTVVDVSVITSHYASGAGVSGSAETGLVLGYHFEEATPGSLANPFSLSSINNNAKSGDQVLLADGTYTGTFELDSIGTSDHPIVFMPQSGAHAIIHGAIHINGANTWLWGFDVTDPDNTANFRSGILATADGTHIINNVIHDIMEGNGIENWAGFTDNVTYGNVFYNVGILGVSSTFYHEVYTQNNYSSDGYKYYVSNIFLDQGDQLLNSYNFHAFTSSSTISGMYLRDNISSNGRFLIGGFGSPSDNEVLDHNYFYSSSPQLGYARPSQVTFTNNYLVQSYILANLFWGTGEARYTQTAPNVFTGNEIYSPSGDGNSDVDVRTSAYVVSGGVCCSRSDAVPALQPTDIFDNNTYGSSFHGNINANNLGNVFVSSLSAWQTATGNAGNTFDAHSTVVALPTTVKVVVIPNEYDSKRANIAVYNWPAGSSVSADISSSGISNGDTYDIYNAKDMLGAAVASGTYSGSAVSIPIAGSAAFKSFVLVINAATAPIASTTTAPTPSQPTPRSGTSTLSWTEGISALDTTWRALAWSSDLSLFVAISNTDVPDHDIMTSPDGVTWTLVEHSTEGFRSVIWVSELGLFVAGGQNHNGTTQEVMTSPDGIHWTHRTSGSINYIVWSPEFHVLIGTNNTAYQTSSDGITWTSHTFPGGTISWSSDLHKFFAVGTDVKTSTDGVTWTTVATGPIHSVGSFVWAHELGMFVGTGYTDSGVHYCSRSSDGMTWTWATCPYGSSGWLGVAYAPELHMVVASPGIGGGAHVISTTDGITWTDVTSSGDNNWIGLVWSGELGRFVALAGTAGTKNQVMYSNNFSFVAPVISSVASSAFTNSGATITWTTDEASDSQVNYGTTTDYGSSSTLNSSLVTSHRVVLSGLNCGTTYHYQASSSYIQQNALSSDATFTTSACASDGRAYSSSASVSGGGYSSPSPSSNASPAASDSSSNTPSAISTPAASSSRETNEYLDTDLKLGSKGEPVKFVQNLLKAEGFFSESVSGIYDEATRVAVIGFQKKNGLDPIGVVGPLTRAALNTLARGTNVSTSNIASLGSRISFSRNLRVGDTGNDVRSLQQLLNGSGYIIAPSGPGSPGKETTYFGSLTQKALARFQDGFSKDILAPQNLAKGTGFFGSSTRTFVIEKYPALPAGQKYVSSPSAEPSSTCPIQPVLVTC